MRPNTIALALAVALSGGSLSAYAQQTSEKAEDKDLEVIQITGSNLKGVDLEDAQPLISIDAESIRNSGANTISELLQNLGVTRGGTGSFNTSTSGATSNSTPAGQAAASLRGLGASSTLTLVNGRRIAASSFAAGNTNFVDVNSIPLSAIKRIDVLPTGASAVYGADAVAGVINYILRDDYDGLELNFGYGDSDAPSNDTVIQLSAIYGHNFDNGNITVFADYYERDAFSYEDRDITRTTFSPATTSTFPRLYWRDTQDELAVVDPSCPAELQTNDADFGGFGDGFCAFDPNPLTQVFPELETYSAGLTTNFEFSDSLQFFGEMLYSHTESNATSNSARFRSESDLSRVRVPVDHPNFPSAWLDEIFPSDASSVQIQGRFNAPREISVETDAIRFLAGLRGEWNDWEWESALNYSRSESEQRAVAGIYNRFTFNAALFGELCADGSTNCTPGVDGLFFNPFGGQTGNEQVLDIIQENPTRDGKSEVLGWDVRFNGVIGELWGNDIASAFGAEIRREEISDNPSEQAVARLENDYIVDVIDFGSSRVSADRTQWAVFAEFNFPITDKLDVQAALRYDHFDDFGGDANPKITARYRATEELVLRGSWATSFRAPSLSQAGAELRTTSFSARCLDPYKDAFCGDAAELNPNSLEVGNPDLQAEEANSFGLGMAWSPTKDITTTLDFWMYKHENVVEVDAESFLTQAYNNPEEFLFCGLVPEGSLGISIDPFYCTFDVDGTEGETLTSDQLAVLEGLGVNDLLFRDHVLQLENTGEQETSGYDFTYTQYIDDTQWGDFRITADVTRIFSFKRDRTRLSGQEQLAGTFRYPKLLGSASLRWNKDAWSAGVTALYTDGYDDEIFSLSDFDFLYIEQNSGVTLYDDVDGDLVPRERDVSSWLTFDAFVGYEASENLYLRLTVNNLTSKEPPFVYGGYRNVDFINHDSMERFFRLSATLTF